MEWVFLGAVVLSAWVILRDIVRQRAYLAARPKVTPHVLRALADTPRPEHGGIPLGNLLTAAPTAEEDGEGIWESMANAVDPASWRPRLAEGVEVMEFPSRSGDDYALIATPDHLHHYKLEIWEARLALLMDGTRSIKDLVLERLEDEGDLDPASIAGLIEMFRVQGILDSSGVNVEELVTANLDPASPGRRKLREFAKTLRIGWGGAEDFTKWAYKRLRFFFRPAGVAISAVIAVSGFIALILTVQSGRFELEFETAPTETAILIFLSFFLTAWHELAHAAALIHFRRRVISSGFMIFFGSPAFFVDASDGQMIPRKGRIIQAFAGPWVELILAGAASLVLFAFPGTGVAPLMYRFAVINYFVIFENLVPLLKLDGYWILADLIGEPDLRGTSLKFLRHELWNRIKTRQRLRLQDWALALYGILGTAYAIFSIYLGLFFWKALFGEIVIELWNGGLQTRVLLVVLALVFAGPIIRTGIDAIRSLIRRVKAFAAQIRFRLEQGWRVEAAELIDALPAFDELSEDVLSDLAGRVRMRPYAAGQPVFRQGDRPEAFYVVRTGEVAVEDIDPKTGDTRILRTLGRGDSFGELGLLDMAPRSATIRAITEAQLFVVDKSAFDRLLADAIDAPKFAPSMQSFAELRALPTFRRLATDRLAEVLEHGEWRTYVTGDTIIEQGEPGDAFYAIARGQATVTIDGEFVRTLGQGAYFGELALLNDTPRTASVTATSAMRVFRLDREGFDKVVAEQFDRARPDPTYRRTLRDMEH